MCVSRKQIDTDRIDCSEVFKIEKSERFPIISYYSEIYIDINNENIK